MNEVLCEGRVRYRSVTRALNHIQTIAGWTEYRNVQLVAEPCEVCNGAHIVQVPIHPRAHLPHECSSKVVHETLEEAKAVAGIMRARWNAKKLKAYQCPYCGKYHTGTKRT